MADEITLESPDAILFLAISDRLEEIVPELKYIDQDLKQLENYDLKPPVNFPCALIDVDELEHTDLGNDPRQMTDGLVIIRIGNPAWSSTANFTPRNIRAKGLSYYELDHKVYKALHGWSPDGHSKLLRRKTKTEGRTDAIRVRIMAFAVCRKDEAAVKRRTIKARPAPGIGQG